MDKNKLAQKLRATFVVELDEHVESLNRELLALEKNPTPGEQGELLKELFRSIHTLKGASRAVAIELIEEACHTIEDILEPARGTQERIAEELFSLLFQVVDAIEEAGMRLREEQDLDGSPLQKLLPRLRQAAADAAPTGESGADDAPSTDTEVNAAECPDASASNRPHEATSDGESSDTGSTDEGSAEKGAEPSPPTVDELDTATAPSSSSEPPETAARPAAAERESHRSGEQFKHKVAAVKGSIRVAADKLDSMMAQSGELLVARQRLEYRAGDAAALHEFVGLLRAEWRAMETPIRRSWAGVKTSDSESPIAPAQLPARAAAILQRTGDRLAQLEKEAERLAAGMAADGRLMGQTCDALDNEVRRVRMLPFAEACGGLARAVRDIAHAEGKLVDLIVEGEDVEMDRSVLEGLKDPLLHLVRNAIDHGIETPADREARGKSATGRVVVSAALRGAHLEVVVADDGAGIDLDRIREKARAKGLDEPKDERELIRLLFLPGFSTTAMVTDLSGRGVGLDVVDSRIQALRGAVGISFEAGRGTRFTLTVPLTLTTIRCVFVSVGDLSYAIPTAHVQHLVRFEDKDVRTAAGQEMLLLGGPPTPLRSLAELLGHGDRKIESTPEKRLSVVVVAGGQEVAFLVDAVTAEQEVLVKNLGPRIRRLRLVSGASLLPSGKMALVLNPGNIVRAALGQATIHKITETRKSKQARAKPRLLLAEDSMTTRALIKNILEAAGYDVTAVADGQLAWQLLQQRKIDLIVSDVDMPKMDGFELAEAVRNSSSTSELPIILVTARETDEDRMRGLQVGANAYLGKSSFDQTNLLETIQQLL